MSHSVEEALLELEVEELESTLVEVDSLREKRVLDTMRQWSIRT
jgi:hypothetical protein